MISKKKISEDDERMKTRREPSDKVRKTIPRRTKPIPTPKDDVMCHTCMVNPKKVQEQERHRHLTILAAFKGELEKEEHTKDYSLNKSKLMLKIAKEGHSFPHYDTCKTCEEDFDLVCTFAISELEKRISQGNSSPKGGG